MELKLLSIYIRQLLMSMALLATHILKLSRELFHNCIRYGVRHVQSFRLNYIKHSNT